METGRKLFDSLKSLVLGRGITFAFFLRIVGKTLLSIDKFGCQGVSGCPSWDNNKTLKTSFFLWSYIY